MIRFALYLCGVAAGVGALLVLRDQRRAVKRVPVKDAAAQLQSAWADYHTRA